MCMLVFGGHLRDWGGDEEGDHTSNKFLGRAKHRPACKFTFSGYLSESYWQALASPLRPHLLLLCPSLWSVHVL